MKFKIKVEMELELQGGMVFEKQGGKRYLLTQEDANRYKWIDLDEYCSWGMYQPETVVADDIKNYDMVYLGMINDLMK